MIPLRLFQGMYDIELTSVGHLDGEAHVGALEFFEPLVALTEDTELLGAQVLRHFVLSFDRINRRVRLDSATAFVLETR